MAEMAGQRLQDAAVTYSCMNGADCMQATKPEGISHRGHGQNHVQVGSALFHKKGIHLWRGDSPASPLSLGGNSLNDGHNLVFGKQVWNLQTHGLLQAW